MLGSSHLTPRPRPCCQSLCWSLAANMGVMQAVDALAWAGPTQLHAISHPEPQCIGTQSCCLLHYQHPRPKAPTSAAQWIRGLRCQSCALPRTIRPRQEGCKSSPAGTKRAWGGPPGLDSWCTGARQLSLPSCVLPGCSGPQPGPQLGASRLPVSTSLTIDLRLCRRPACSCICDDHAGLSMTALHSG